MISRFLMLLVLVTINGCSSHDIKETIGLGRKSPDEFMVLMNAPLVIPNSSVLPKPGTVQKVSTNRSSPQDQVKAAFGSNSTGGEASSSTAVSKASSSINKSRASSSTSLSQGEDLFLSQISSADNNIKEKISADNEDRIVNFFTDSISVEVVDSAKEAERIKNLKAKGEVINGNDSLSVTVQEKVSK